MRMYRGWLRMNLLERDLQPFWYANYQSRTMLMDGDGLPTGEYSIGYGDPEQAFGTFSENKGAATPREFGTFIDYDYTIHMAETVCPFDEEAAIWLNHDPSEDPDFRVLRIAELPTYTAVAIRQLR